MTSNEVKEALLLKLLESLLRIQELILRLLSNCSSNQAVKFNYSVGPVRRKSEIQPHE